MTLIKEVIEENKGKIDKYTHTVLRICHLNKSIDKIFERFIQFDIFTLKEGFLLSENLLLIVQTEINEA